MADGRRGFHVAAPPLLSQGWLPFPLPPGQKSPPPDGFTGETPEAIAAAESTEAWREAIREYLKSDDFAAHNTGVRMPGNVFILDVDDYHTLDGKVKSGWKNLIDFAESVGLEHPAKSLPKTFRSTARGFRGPSGHRFYRLPDGLNHEEIMRALPSRAAAGVDILRPQHRYTIEAGSLHPEGGIYQVFNERASKPRPLSGGISAFTPDEVPEIPRDWLRALLAVKPAATDAEGVMTTEARAEAWATFQGWLDKYDFDVDDLTREQVLGMLTIGSRRAVLSFDSDSVNNDTVSARCVAMLATFMEDVSDDDPVPLRDAIAIAKDLYVSHGNRKDRPREFDRALGWAFPIAHRKVLGKGDTASVLDVAREMLEEDFWGQTSTLRSCRDFARGRLVAPDAMLACAVVIVASHLPPHLVLPGLVGDVAGLNFYVALAAASGGGKSAAMKAAKAWLNVIPHPDSDPATDKPYSTTVATAQGLIQAYTVTRAKAKSEQVRPGDMEHIQVRRSVAFEIDEIGALGAAMHAEGSMLKDFLKSMWTGSGVGTTAAEATRVRHLDEHSYRTTIVAGVQPSTADVILSGHGDGFPQRWLWVEAFDEKPLTLEEWRERRATPSEPLNWSPPLAAYPLDIPKPSTLDDDQPSIIQTRNRANFDIPSGEKFVEVGITESFELKVFQAAAGRHRRIGDADVSMEEVLDGHGVLLQEKLAALIAALHGSTEITDQYERIAEHLTNKSDNVRAAIIEERTADARKQMEAQARRQGESAVISLEAQNVSTEARLIDTVGRLLGDNPDGLSIPQIVRMAPIAKAEEVARIFSVAPGFRVEDGAVFLNTGEST